MTEKEKTLDLATLEWIKFNFQLLSDHSCGCQGYRNLCRLIDRIKDSENILSPTVPTPSEYNNPANVKVGWDVLRMGSRCLLCGDTGEYITGGSFGGSVEHHRCVCKNGKLNS